MAIAVAEMLFQDAGLFAGAEYLQRDDDGETPEKLWSVEEEGQPSQQECPENVDGIANFCIDAVGDQSGGFGADGEGVPQLEAGYGEGGTSSQDEEHAENANGGPRWVGEIQQKKRDADDWNYRNNESAALHVAFCRAEYHG